MQIFTGEDIMDDVIIKTIKSELRSLDIRNVSENAIYNYIYDYFGDDGYANSNKIYYKVYNGIKSKLNNAMNSGRYGLEQVERLQKQLDEMNHFIEMGVSDEIVWRISKGHLSGIIKELSEEIQIKQNRNRNPDGTSGYSNYLLSDYWKDLSREVKKRDGDRCVLCNATNSLQVHHRSYEYKGTREKEILDLHTLCKDCHSLFHTHSKLSGS